MTPALGTLDQHEALRIYYLGITEHLRSTSYNLQRRHEKLRNQIADDHNLLHAISLCMAQVTSSLEQRKALFCESERVLDELDQIRVAASSALESLSERFSKEDKRNVEYLPCLETLEMVTKLERLPLPVSTFLDKSKGLYKTMQIRVMEIQNELKQDLTEAQQAHRQQSEMEEKVRTCLQLLSPVQEKLAQSESPRMTEVTSLRQIVAPLSKEEDSVLVRPLPSQSAWQVNNENSYVDEEDLLDQVIYAGDPDLFHQYQLTCRYFTSPPAIFAGLVARFYLVPSSPAPIASLKQYRALVLQFLLSWVKDFYWPDFGVDLNLEEFLRGAATLPGLDASCNVIKQALHSGAEAQKQPRPSLWRRDLALPSNPLKLMELKAKDFAKQFAIYSYHMYSQVKPTELVGQHWGSRQADRMEHCPNLVRYSDHYNQTLQWCCQKILEGETELERSNVMSFFIHILLLSFQFNNFLAVFIITSALNSVAVYRLSRSWILVPEAQRRIFWVLTELTASSGRLYKEELKDVVPPAVPYLGTTLTDLTFIEDGNANRNSAGQVNFHFRCVKVHDTITKALQFQQPYSFSPQEAVLYQMHQSFTNCETMSDEAMYERSLALEKRSPSPFDDWKDDEGMRVYRELQTYRGVEVLRAFGSCVEEKRTSRLDRLSATTLPISMPARMRRRSRSLAGSGENDVIQPGTLSREGTDSNVIERPHSSEASLRELVTRMKLHETGLRQHHEHYRGRMRFYFHTQELLDWMTTYHPDTRYKILEIVQRLFDEGFIDGLDNAQASTLWTTDPTLKLKFHQEHDMQTSSRNLRSLLQPKLSQSSIAPTAQTDIKSIAAKMQDPEKGLRQMGDNGHFLSKDLLAWLVMNLNISRVEMLDVAQKLFDENYLEGVSDANAGSRWMGEPFLKIRFRVAPTYNFPPPNIPPTPPPRTGAVARQSTPPIITTAADKTDESSSSEGLGMDSSSTDPVVKQSQRNLVELCTRMKHPQSGLKVKTRKWMFRRFNNCFIAEQAVTWLAYHLELPSREQAVRVGLEMEAAGLIAHVTQDQEFQDKYLFFQFK